MGSLAEKEKGAVPPRHWSYAPTSTTTLPKPEAHPRDETRYHSANTKCGYELTKDAVRDSRMRRAVGKTAAAFRFIHAAGFTCDRPLQTCARAHPQRPRAPRGHMQSPHFISVRWEWSSWRCRWRGRNRHRNMVPNRAAGSKRGKIVCLVLWVHILQRCDAGVGGAALWWIASWRLSRSRLCRARDVDGGSGATGVLVPKMGQKWGVSVTVS